MKRSHKVTLLIVIVLLLDQAFKFYIKTTFAYNEERPLFGDLEWARLHFVENEGMAFGITFGWEYGKLLLSLFRILMVAGLIWYMRLLLAARVSMGFVYSVGLITAGALGNIIDSAFYGLIFTESPVHQDGVVAQLVAPGQGYGTFLHGRVVDMLYFPIKWINVPEWVPGLGGDQYLFFSPIFNLADTAITTGVLTILFFQRRFFRDSIHTEEVPALVTVSSDVPLPVETTPEISETPYPDYVSKETEESITTHTENHPIETTVAQDHAADYTGDMKENIPGEHPSEK